MSKGIKPVNYTYGVGLEFVATTGKQVKDELKSNLNNLTKLMKQYNEVLKVDPDADLSKLFNEMKRLQSLVDGIKNSDNPFADFVDKGVLDKTAKLESGLKTISSTANEVKADLGDLKTSVDSVSGAVKSVGQTNFPATFENLFGDAKDQSNEIQAIFDQINELKASITEFDKLRKEITKFNNDESKIGKNASLEQIRDWVVEFKDLRSKLSDKSSLNFVDVSKITQEATTIAIKLHNAIQEIEDLDTLKGIGINQKYIANLQKYIGNVGNTFDSLIDTIKQKQTKLNTELETLSAEQAKYQAAQIATASGKSLGSVINDDGTKYKKSVDILPKTNEAAWIDKINDTIHNIEGRLDAVRLTPTFSKNAKGMEKEINGSLAQINHAINVDLKLTDNIQEFNKQVNNIDQSIKNAKSQLEKNGNFKLKFEYEEGGRFKDAAYALINQYKKFTNIQTTFYIANGKKFVSDVIGLRHKATEELKDIPANIVIGNENTVLQSVDNLRSQISSKIGNIGVNLTLQNMPQFMAQAALMRDSIEQYYSDNPIGVVAGPNGADSNVPMTTAGIEELSEKAKEAQEQVNKIQAALKSLTEMGLKSPEFLQLGRFDENLKSIKGSKDQVKQLLDGYNELYAKTHQTKEELAATYGRTAEGYDAYSRDMDMMEQAESMLNTILQSQIKYAQSRLEFAQKTLEKEKQISAVKKEQSNANIKGKSSPDNSQAEANKQLAMSAEEATKKIRSLNGTLTQQKRTLKDLEANKFQASSFTRLGEWDKEAQSFKKNSQDIKDLIKRYEKLRQARIAAGGKTATGEEASLRGKLGAILKEQKRHTAEIIAQNEKELASVKGIAAAYKQTGANKAKAAKAKVEVDTSSSNKSLDELNTKLDKAQKTLRLLKSKKFDALGKTGLGDVNKHLESLGSKQSFKELIAFYNQLIAKRDELEKAGKTGSPEYIQYAKIYQNIEQQLNTIYQDQLKYTQTRIEQLKTEIQKERELLQVKEKQTTEEVKQASTKPDHKVTTGAASATSATVKLDGASLSSLAKDETLKAIDGKINNILTQLGSGVVINGSNISIEASNVSVSGKGASVNGGTKSSKTPPGQKEVEITTLSSYTQQLVALEERIKRTSLYTDGLKQRFVELNAQLNAIRVKDDADTYKFDLDRFKEDFEQLKTYDQLYQNLIKSQTKQILLNDQIATSNGPTAELQEQLKIETEKSQAIEEQLFKYTKLYNNRARQLAMEEAIKNANQAITQNIAAQSDKSITKQNNELVKIVDSAQQKLNDMQYSMQNSKIPMADAAIAKFKQYEQLLSTLKTKQQEIIANPGLLKDQGYKESFDTLLRQMKNVESEFATLQNSSQNFLSKIKSLNDIKLLGSVFDATNLDLLHNAMQEFANQAGVGAAKLIEFNDIERTATFEIQNSKGQVQQLTVAYDAATNSLGRFISRTKDSTSATQKFLNSLKHSFQNVARYVASFGSVYRLFSIIRQGFTYVRDIDSALTELKKVTDETDATYNRFLQTMSKTAGVVGSTVKDLTTMSAEWARLGYTMQESAKLAESTAILLNVSEFTDATQASEALISTMQAFQYTADESQHVVDILNEVGNNYAVSSDGIATALQDSASALMAAGNNLEQSVALVAAANKVVQDPNSVGSALRTISLRLRGTSVQVLEEMGEETDGVVESISKMQSKIQALSGVNILTDAGEYKDTYAILYEIGQVWEEMSDIDQAALLELMAGKNRANTLAAILSNMTDLKGAYESALNAEGSALRENEAYLDSIQGRIDLFTNALQTFWMNFIDSNTAKGAVDLGTILIKLLDTAYGKIIALIGVMAVFQKIKHGVKFTDMFNGAVGVTKEVIAGMKSIVSATKSLEVATISLKLAEKGVKQETVANIMTTSGLSTATGILTKEQIKAAAATLTTAFKNGELTASQYLATMSTMGLKTALHGLWTVLMQNPVIVVAAAITAAALAFDHFHITAQEAADAAKEAFDEIQSVVESTKSTIQELESELTTLQDKIEELDGKQLSFAEDQELEKLKKQRVELEHSLKVQEQLLELQRNASNNQAIASMKAYTKAASEGAQETQETAKTWGTIAGVIAGIALTVATGGAGLGVIAAGGIAGGVVGNKTGEIVGSGITENDGTYDDWYETYTKALETAREEEQKALKKYQKDSSNIDKLDKWQEAQQKTSDIETEMYEHLSQMQQYYNGLEYGISDEIDKELDTWYNFLDKLSIDQGASGSETTALDRIFGENANEEVQSIKEQILDAIGSGKEFDFDSAVNSSQQLKNTLDYIGLSAEDVKNYFTQIGEAAKNITTENIDPVKTYTALSEDAENYKDILQQTSEIVSDNIKVTQEYKDSLKSLGISEEELNECFDENNNLIVKDASALNKLVKSAKNGTAQNIKLAKSQARLKYYETYKEIRKLTQGKKVESAATLAQVKLLYAEMTALQKTIARYSMLEHQLLGTTNAYEEFAKAQEIDGANDYETQAEELVGYLVDAFHTGKLGAEAAQAAIKGLVPESVYADLDTLDDKMSAVYKYFTEDLSKYFYVKFNDDGSLESAEMLVDNVKQFVEDGINKNGVFTGSWEEWDLDPSINSLDELAEKMDVTKEVAYAFLQAMETYDISWIGGDASTLLDKLIPDTTEIQNFAQQMQEEFNQTPIDLTARVKVSAEKMKEAGYTDFEGEYATLYTHTFGFNDENGEEYFVNVTPILPDGSVIQDGAQGLMEYINGQIASGKSLSELDIFLGSYKTVEEAEAAAQRLHELQEDYYSMLSSYDLENAIYSTTQKQAALEMKLATGQVSLSDEATLNEYNALNAEAELNAQLAYEQALGYQEANKAYSDAKDSAEALAEEMSKMKKGTGEYADKEKELKTYTDAMKKAHQTMVKLGEPTEVTLMFASDKVQQDMDDLKKRFEKNTVVMSVFAKIEGKGIEGLTDEDRGADGKYTLDAIARVYPELHDDENALVAVQQYLSYFEAQHTIDMQLGQNVPTTAETLQSINDTLEDIALILSKAYNIDLDTTDAETQLSGLETRLQEIKTRFQEFGTWWDGLWGANPIRVEGDNGGTLLVPSSAALSGAGGVNGTAHARGTAFAGGSWGAPQSETALVGELGPELLVRGNRWTTIGDNGAEFTDIKKGDIIFNHKQTEALLSKGYVAGRGKAYASGTAYDGGSVHPWLGGMNIDDDWKNIYPSIWSDATNGEYLSDLADSVDDATDEFKEIFDWVEVRLEEIEEQLSLLNAQLENAVGYQAQNQIIDATIELNEVKLDNLEAGLSEYEQYASALLTKVPAEYREAAQNGAIAIEEFAGEADETTLKAIQDYREWAQKAADVKQQIEEIEATNAALAKQKFDNVANQYDNQIGLIETSNEQLDAQISLMEDRGYVAATAYYEAMMGNTQDISAALIEERNLLQQTLDEEVKAGNIKVGSDDWYEAVQAIKDVDAAIVECEADTESYQNAINDIYWDNFDQLINRYDYLSDETQNLIDLMSDADMVTKPDGKTYENGTVEYWTADDVKWTDEGIASLGLYAQQMEIAEAKSKEYAKAIDDLNADYKAGKYSENEYLEKLNELKGGQYDAIKSYKDAKEAIKDLNATRVESIKEGIEKEIEAYEELINKKKEELDAEKD